MLNGNEGRRLLSSSRSSVLLTHYGAWIDPIHVCHFMIGLHGL